MKLYKTTARKVCLAARKRICICDCHLSILEDSWTKIIKEDVLEEVNRCHDDLGRATTLSQNEAVVDIARSKLIVA
jgi:hypothetical protein